MYRAASFWTSAYAPEISMGMRTVEEVEDAEYVELREGDNEKSSIAQLKAEKEQNAGKSIIDLKEPTDTKEQPTTNAQEGVDKGTGEVKSAGEAQQPVTAAPAY